MNYKLIDVQSKIVNLFFICKFWRTLKTRPQTEFSLVKQLINLDNAFIDLPVVRDLQIFLFDDVMTNCSTLNATARCLKEAGASRVGTVV